MKIVFFQNAEYDIQKAYDWYESKQYGLGKRFFEEVVVFLKRLSRNNVVYRKYYKDIRYILLYKFPFSILFLTEKLLAFIIAVLHNKQNIREILKQRGY